MADFPTALRFVLKNEGGYENNPADPGGETYQGISRRFWPGWEGWKLVDELKSTSEGMKTLRLLLSPGLDKEVEDFYQANFWKFAALASQAVANKIMDICVNQGLGEGVFEVQQSLAALVVGPVVKNRLWSEQTEALVNAADPDALLLELRYRQVRRYVDILLADPREEQFEEGWLRRAVE